MLPVWTSLGAVLAVLALAGCRTPPHGLTLETVGPVYRHGGPDSERGYLRVYSATVDVNDGDIFFFPHSSYEVWTPDGKFVRGVINHAGSNDERPMTVALQPGDYMVYAQAAGCGIVKVPVVIRRTWMTALHLDHRGLPSSVAAEERAWVRLPGGRIVGPRASPAAAE